MLLGTWELPPKRERLSIRGEVNGSGKLLRETICQISKYVKLYLEMLRRSVEYLSKPINVERFGQLFGTGCLLLLNVMLTPCALFDLATGEAGLSGNEY